MKIPTIQGVIRRRLLLNYRMDPDVVSRLLPANSRPKTIDDPAIFPSDRIEFDHALLMRDLAHEWHAEPMMDAEDATARA